MAPEVRAAVKKVLISLACLTLFVAGWCWAPPSESKIITPFDVPNTYLFQFDNKTLPALTRSMDKRNRAAFNKYLVKGITSSWVLVELPSGSRVAYGFNPVYVAQPFHQKAQMVLDLHGRKTYRGSSMNFQNNLASLPDSMINVMPIYRGSLK